MKKKLITKISSEYRPMIRSCVDSLTLDLLILFSKGRHCQILGIYFCHTI